MPLLCEILLNSQAVCLLRYKFFNVLFSSFLPGHAHRVTCNGKAALTASEGGTYWTCTVFIDTYWTRIQILTGHAYIPFNTD